MQKQRTTCALRRLRAWVGAQRTFTAFEVAKLLQRAEVRGEKTGYMRAYQRYQRSESRREAA